MRKYILLLLVFIVCMAFVSAYDTSEYLKEFSNEGEVCEAIDVFEYHQYDPQWWNSNYFAQTIPVFYHCCKDDYCTTIIVDLQGKSLMKNDYYNELIDLNYIKFSMNNGDLTKTSFISKGLSSCHFHGEDKLNQESLNLVADTAEAIALTQSSKQAKQVVDVVKTARALELVTPFGIADFGLSVACNYNNKKIEKAVEKIAECNLYLSNIQNHYARTGYVYRLSTCLDEARSDFKEYRDMDFAKVKNAADKTINAIAAIFNFFKGLTDDPTNINADFSIEKTEYEIAGDIYNEIKDKKLYLHNPHKSNVYEKYETRIIQKIEAYNKSKTEAEVSHTIAYNNKPDSINVIFSDIFNEPNYNLTEASELYRNTKQTHNNCELLYKQVKFNSAIECMNIVKKGYDDSNEIFQRENKVERSFDVRWRNAIIIIFILIIVFYLVKTYMLRRE